MEGNRGWGKVSEGNTAAALEGNSEFATWRWKVFEGRGSSPGISVAVGKSIGMLQELQTGRVIPAAGPFGDTVGSEAGGNQPMGLE